MAAHTVPVNLFADFDESPAAYLRVSRGLGAAPGTRLAMAATFTLDVIQPYLRVEGTRCGVPIEVSFAPYNQLEQTLLDANSPVYAADPKVIAIAMRLEDVSPALAEQFLSPSVSIDREIDAVTARLEQLVGAARTHSRAQLLIFNFVPVSSAAGLADLSLEQSQTGAIAGLNARIAEICRGISGAFVFDVARIAEQVGLERWTDARLLHWARVPYSTTAQIAIAKGIARYVRALERPPCKCLVLDLDNTLWGGVLGEDGLAGIALSDSYPGNVFKAFQRLVRSYRDRGILLALASKNNEADVVEAFQSHSDMVLRLEDFAARQVHWNDKATSLTAIAAELNIGVDALAFFDDNPVERAWVREQLPGVAVIDVPKDPLHYAAALQASQVFDTLVLTQEDHVRAEIYRTDTVRKTLQASAGTVEGFLEALAMKITLGDFDAANLPEIVQLLGKTNQFNLTTRRYTESEITAMLARGAIGVWMRVEDKFGDNGLVGVAIAMPDNSEFRLDSFLMSCRVLGRMAEQTLLDGVVRRIRARGAHTLFAEFIPTKKNAPAANFLPTNGFTEVGSRWQLPLANHTLASKLFTIIDP